MVQFKKRNNVIPVNFEDFELAFVANDENFIKMNELAEVLKKASKEIIESNDSCLIIKVKDTLEHAWNELFGPESFNKVYEFSGQSSINCLVYFLETVDGIVAEYNSQSDTNVIKKYLEK